MVRMLVLAAVLALAARADAQTSLRLDIRDGRVTLEATAVPPSQILAEWARVGGTRVVGAERITGAPLTLSLQGVPERQALDIVLRSVAGYVAAPRTDALAGTSSFDRILVMATSTAPPAAAAAGRRGTAQAPTPVQQDTRVDDNAEVATEAQQNLFVPVQQPDVNGMPQNPFGQPTPFGTPMSPTQGNPFQPVQNPFGQPMTPPQPGMNPFTFTPVPQNQGQPVTLPFGAATPGQPTAAPPVFGSPVPGVPQQPVVPQPPPGQRPPGSRN